MNINMFYFFDDEGRAQHPLAISRKNYERAANLINWNEYYEPISSIARLFSNITTRTSKQLLSTWPWLLVIERSPRTAQGAKYTR